MNVYFCTYNFTDKPTSGSDRFHYHLSELFISWGWNVKAWVNQAKQRYQVGPVMCHPTSDHIHNEMWADIIIAIPPTHLMCKKGKPLFIIKHNIGEEQFRFDKNKIIYCGEAVRKHLKMYCLDSFIWNPHNKYAGTEDRGDPNGVWLLVNCNENKGGKRLLELAARYPQKRFAGVIGAYGDQVRGNLPNVEYWPTIEDMSQYYRKACGILSLSRYEGFPTVLLEAMSFDLPVIALDIPGVRDACSYAANYFDKVEQIDMDCPGSGRSIERANQVQFERDWDGLKRFLTT